MVWVTAPIEEGTLRFVLDHPGELGLPNDASQASVVSRVIELGARELRRQLRESERDRLYLEWADDPERQDAVAFHLKAARETGAY